MPPRRVRCLSGAGSTPPFSHVDFFSGIFHWAAFNQKFSTYKSWSAREQLPYKKVAVRQGGRNATQTRYDAWSGAGSTPPFSFHLVSDFFRQEFPFGYKRLFIYGNSEPWFLFRCLNTLVISCSLWEKIPWRGELSNHDQSNWTWDEEEETPPRQVRCLVWCWEYAPFFSQSGFLFLRTIKDAHYAGTKRMLSTIWSGLSRLFEFTWW